MVIELDRSTMIVGLPKHGKTTIARRIALEHLREFPSGLAFVHDQQEQFVPDLTRMYEDAAEWRKAQAKKEPLPRGASFRCGSSEVRDLAVEIGRRHNRDKNVKVPILLVYDESSLMDTSGSTHMDKKDFQVFALRRHWGIHAVLNTQKVSNLMDGFYEQAVDVFVFNQNAENAALLEKRLSLAKGALASTVNAPKFRFVHCRQGEGVVSEGETKP